MNHLLKNTIKAAFESKGLKFFETGKYNLNIFAVRSTIARSNKFDDLIYCVYMDEYDNWRIHQWKCTTDPGYYWLKNPSRVEGTAILVPGQYRGVYKIDKHGGKYEALCQRNGKVKVYRDGNKDQTHDMEASTIQNGVFGINIHKAGADSENVEKWSAGCTVFKRASDFEIFINICRKSREVWGNSFTYTLFEESDF